MLAQIPKTYSSGRVISLGDEHDLTWSLSRAMMEDEWRWKRLSRSEKRPTKSVGKSLIKRHIALDKNTSMRKHFIWVQTVARELSAVGAVAIWSRSMVYWSIGSSLWECFPTWWSNQRSVRSTRWAPKSLPGVSRYRSARWASDTRECPIARLSVDRSSLWKNASEQRLDSDRSPDIWRRVSGRRGRAYPKPMYRSMRIEKRCRQSYWGK